MAPRMQPHQQARPAGCVGAAFAACVLCGNIVVCHILHGGRRIKEKDFKHTRKGFSSSFLEKKKREGQRKREGRRQQPKRRWRRRRTTPRRPGAPSCNRCRFMRVASASPRTSKAARNREEAAAARHPSGALNGSSPFCLWLEAARLTSRNRRPILAKAAVDCGDLGLWARPPPGVWLGATCTIGICGTHGLQGRRGLSTLGVGGAAC